MGAYDCFTSRSMSMLLAILLNQVNISRTCLFRARLRRIARHALRLSLTKDCSSGSASSLLSLCAPSVELTPSALDYLGKGLLPICIAESHKPNPVCPLVTSFIAGVTSKEQSRKIWGLSMTKSSSLVPNATNALSQALVDLPRRRRYAAPEHPQGMSSG